MTNIKDDSSSPRQKIMIPIEDVLECFAVYRSVRDENGKIVDFMTEYINDAACECNHMTRESQIGRTLLELLPAHKENGLFDEYCKVAETGKTLFKESFLFEDSSKDQEVKATVDIMAIKYGDGYAANWRDITERKNIENALKVSEACFKSAFEYTAVGMTLAGFDFKPIKVNKAFCEMLGYTEKELLNITFKDFTHPDDLDKDLECAIKLVNSEIQNYQMEKRYIRKDGHIVWVILSVSAVRDENGRNLYYITQSQDITRIKQANEALEYDKLKTEFFANISHELRTPTNIILNALKMLGLNIRNSFPPKNLTGVNKYMKMIMQNCYRLIRLINNIIDATKIDAGFYSLNTKNCNIVEIIENITSSVKEYIKDKELRLIFDTSIEEKTIACDPDKIERIILNLLSNAIKFSKKNGIIKVHLRNEEGYIIVTVKDNGIGIKKENLTKIFERFGQVDKSLTRNQEGSGIGLSIVKSFVEMQGGTVSVESRYGHGSTFIIKLPDKMLEEKNESRNTKGSILNNSVETINVEFSDIYLEEKT